MDQRPIEQLTLRDLLSNAEWLVRETIQHLEQSFLPRARTAEDLVRSYNIPAERREISDSTVRSRMAALLGSDDYSQTMFSRLEQHLAAIDERAQRAIQQRDTH